jgi:hypothetical protein
LLDKIIDKTIDLIFSKSSIIGIFIVILVIMHLMGFNMTEIGANPMTSLIILVLVFFLNILNYGNIELVKIDLTNFRKSDINHQSLKTLIESVSMISERLKTISELSMDTYHTVKSIPSKKLVLMNIDSITMFLVIDTLKPLINYIFNINSAKTTSETLNRYQKNLDREFKALRLEYLAKIQKLTKGNIEVGTEESINNLFEDMLKKVYIISTDISLNIENKVSEVIYLLEDLKKELRPLYENGIVWNVNLGNEDNNE